MVPHKIAERILFIVRVIYFNYKNKLKRISGLTHYEKQVGTNAKVLIILIRNYGDCFLYRCGIKEASFEAPHV